MSNRKTLRCLALLLSLLLLLSGCGSVKAEPEATPEPPKYSFEPELTVGELFRMGNEAYLSRDYEKAEACYLCAIERAEQTEEPDSGTEATLFRVRNNLVLTLLQLEKNEEAWKLSSELIALEAPDQTDHFGCILNHLVCAGATGRSAAEVLNELAHNGLYQPSVLDDLAVENPGIYMKLALGLVYNAMYIDMEDDAVEKLLGMSSAPPIPLLSAEDYDALIQYAEDRGASLMMILDILGNLQAQNAQTFGEEDPDITALIEYVDALLETKLEG